MHTRGGVTLQHLSKTLVLSPSNKTFSGQNVLKTGNTRTTLNVSQEEDESRLLKSSRKRVVRPAVQTETRPSYIYWTDPDLLKANKSRT